MTRHFVGLILMFLACTSFGQSTLPAGGNEPVTLGQPALAIKHVIARDGVLPNSGSSGMTIGMVYWVGAAFPNNPFGQPTAIGTSLSVSAPENTALFAVLGNTYGSGVDTFNVPDLRARFAYAAGNFDWGSSSVLGQVQGAAQSVISSSQLPAHQHVVNSSGVISPTQSAGQANPAPVSLLAPSLSLRFLINSNGNFPSTVNVTTPPFIGQIQAFAGSSIPGGWLPAEGQTLQIAEHNNLFQVIGTTYGGDGQTTFALPDLRGRLPVGFGQGPGLPPITIGQEIGAPDVVLTEANLPSHIHGLPFGGSTNPIGQGQGVNLYQPSLGIMFMIAIQGEFPSNEPGMYPQNGAVIGNIYAFAGDFIPTGFVACNGILISIAQNTALFALLGTTYGGNGQSNFGLPDLRGRSPVGPDSNLFMGQTVGSPTQLLNLSQMTSHVHGISIIDPLFSNSFE